MLGLGRVVDPVGQLHRTQAVQVLVEKVEIVLLQVLQVVLRLNSLQKRTETVLGERLRMLVEDLHRQVECPFGMGRNLQHCVEKILRRLAVDPIPDIFGGEVVLGEYFLREQESIVSERVGNSSDVLANSDLPYRMLTACPR